MNNVIFFIFEGYNTQTKGMVKQLLNCLSLPVAMMLKNRRN